MSSLKQLIQMKKYIEKQISNTNVTELIKVFEKNLAKVEKKIQEIE